MVVGLALEPGQGREGADGDHLQVGELAVGDRELGKVGGFGAEAFGLRAAREQVDEGASVRSDLVDVGHGRLPAFRSGYGTPSIRNGLRGRLPAPDHPPPSRTRKGGPLQTLLQPDELLSLNDRFEEAHPREILTWALERSGLERIAIASAFQAEGTIVMHMATQMRPDIPILFLETGYQFAETLAFKEQLAERLGLNVVDLVGEYTVERQAEVDGSTAVRARSGDVLRPQQGAADVRGAPRTGRVDHRVPAGIVTDARDGAVRAAVRAGAGSLDREGEPDGRVVAARGLGVPEGARPPAQPALRPGVQLDRLRAVHADAACPTSRSAPDAGRACRSGSAGSR